MGKLNIGDKKLKLAILGGVLVVVIVIVGSLKFFVFKDKDQPGQNANTDTHERTDYSPQEIVDLAPTPEYAYSRLYTTADIAKRQGDMGKAEAYLVEAVNQAKLTNDQTTIDNAYGMLIRFYESQGNQTKLAEIKSTIGEEKYNTLTAPPPAEEVPFW